MTPDDAPWGLSGSVPAAPGSPGRGPTVFTHLLLHRRLGCDSLLDQHCLRGAGDDGAAVGAVWGPPLAKRGVFLLERLVESGGCGVRVRRLGRDRAGEMRITRFLIGRVSCRERVCQLV